MENISKILISADGKRLGYVLDVAIDFVKMQKLGYYVVDEESEEEFLLRNENILSISSDFVLIENAQVLEFAHQRETLFGKHILDEHCQDYGTLQTIVFKNKKCTKFVTDKCEILAKKISVIGRDFIFAQFHRKKNAAQKRAFPREQADQKVSIQGGQKPTVPEVVRLSSAFYVGKISSQDIVGYNNEKIVGQGEVVTSLVVKKAKLHNKLNQLYFATR